MTTALPKPAPCGHLTHLKRGVNNYGWDSETDRWDKCTPAPMPARRPRAVAAVPEPEHDPFMSAAEIAARLDVSKMTVYRLIHGGDMRAVQVGRSYRVRQSAFAKYLQSAEVDAS